MDKLMQKGYDELLKVNSLDNGDKIFDDGSIVPMVYVRPDYDDNGIFFVADFRHAPRRIYIDYVKGKLEKMRFATAQEAADYVINLAERINEG